MAGAISPSESETPAHAPELDIEMIDNENQAVPKELLTLPAPPPPKTLPAIQVPFNIPYIGSSPRRHAYGRGNSRQTYWHRKATDDAVQLRNLFGQHPHSHPRMNRNAPRSMQHDNMENMEFPEEIAFFGTPDDLHDTTGEGGARDGGGGGDGNVQHMQRPLLTIQPPRLSHPFGGTYFNVRAANVQLRVPTWPPSPTGEVYVVTQGHHVYSANSSTYTGLPPPTPITPTNLHWEVHDLQTKLEAARGESMVLTHEVHHHRELIASVAANNTQLYDYLTELSAQMKELRSENAALREEIMMQHFVRKEDERHVNQDIRTPAHSRQGSQEDEHTHLAVQSPEGLNRLSIHDSPARSAVQATAPNTPTRSRNTNNPRTAANPAFNLLHKRKVHNLNSLLPAIYAQFPRIPLTDTELVVYFFNSLSRPAPTIRLYTRGWGPAKIVEVLNKHRNIEPPFLRNTCSVKCVTAQRRGVAKFGAKWDEDIRNAFKNSPSDDVKATELIQVTPNECEAAVDIDVLDLLKNLTTHPELENRPKQHGIFTRCVMWAEDNGVSWKMSDLHLLAQALEEGITPVPPQYPTGDASFFAQTLLKEESDEDRMDEADAVVDNVDGVEEV